LLRQLFKNGLGSIEILFAAGEINPLLGPSPAGIIGSIAFTLFAPWVLLNRRILPTRINYSKNG